jgi:hypothetical protein
MKSHPLNLLALALCLTFGVAAQAQTMSKEEYKMAGEKISADYKAGKIPCASLAGNAKDICMAEVKGTEKTAKAELDANYKPSAKAHRNARDAKADAVYAVAKLRCKDHAGNAKDVCIKEAKSVEAASKADSKLQQKTYDAKADAKKTSNEAVNKANEKVSEARSEAAADKTDAKYKVAKEKCDALSGVAKDNCLSDAKLSFGK